jgi:hypothetical protein
MPEPELSVHGVCRGTKACVLRLVRNKNILMLLSEEVNNHREFKKPSSHQRFSVAGGTSRSPIIGQCP